MFLNKIFFKNQKIREQYFDGKNLWLITTNNTGIKHTLYKNKEKIATSKEIKNLIKKMEE
jgi:hypothetical protein